MSTLELFVLNSTSFWKIIISNTDVSDWFTLTGGVLSGVIAGALTFFGVKLTINHNEKKEILESLPKLEVLDHQLYLSASQNREQRGNIVFNIQNFGGTIAKNIESEIMFKDFEKLVNKAVDAFPKISPKANSNSPKVDSRIFGVANNYKGRAAYLIIANMNMDNIITDNHYGTINEKYHRLLGNCVPINLNYEAKAQLILPADIHGWLTYFFGIAKFEVFEEGLFDMLLKLSYSSLNNEKYNKEFELKFEYSDLVESSQNEYVNLINVKAIEIK